MLSKRIRYGLIAGVVAVAAGLMLIYFCWSGTSTPDNFPAKTATRIELRPDPTGEEIRFSFVDDGNKTLTQIEYRNGVTSYIFHRPDGTAKEIKEFYPAAEGETARQLKSQVSFETDGKAYLRHSSYRVDGSLENQGERTESGQYESTWFFEDGVSRSKLRVYDSKRQLVSADGYYQNGSLASQTRRTNPSELVTKFFAEGGKLTHEFTQSSVLSGVFYDSNGSIRARFMDSGWKLNSQYFDKGELVLEVEYYKDFMEVTSYGPDSKMRVEGGNPAALHRQIWNRISGEECTATYRLFKVEGFWQLSNDKATYSRQTVEMSEDGTSAVSVETETIESNLRSRKVKILDLDGSVKFVKEYKEDILFGERSGTDADRVDIKALLDKPQFECLPIPSKTDRYKAHSSFI